MWVSTLTPNPPGSTNLSILPGDGRKSFSKSSQGYAIEFRITCEDFEKDFRPSPGRIDKLVLPGGFGVRVDTHIYEGYSVPQYYDSLLAKLIVWGETREEAIRRGKRALSEFIIEGNLKTTIPFHMKLLEHENFIRGELDTKILETKILPQIKTL